MEEIKTAVEEGAKEEGEKVENAQAEAKEEVVATGEELKDAKAELKDPDLTEAQRDKVQARFDTLTAQLKSLREELAAERAAKTEKAAETPKVTEAALVAMLNDPAQTEYHEWARLELSKMYTKKEVENLKAELQRGSSIRAQLDATAEDYPDMLDAKSELWKLANDLYISEDLAKAKNGVKHAVELAARRLGIKAENDAEKLALQKKVDKANANKALATGGKKVVVSETAAADKLKTKALAEGPNSQAWRDWQKAIVRKTRKDI